MTKAEEKKMLTKQKKEFIKNAANCVFDFAKTLQEIENVDFRLSYEKRGNSQYFHFLEYQKKVSIKVYKNGNIAISEEGFSCHSDFEIFNYETQSEYRDSFLKTFKTFLTKFIPFYTEEACFEPYYSGDEAKILWNELSKKTNEETV